MTVKRWVQASVGERCPGCFPGRAMKWKCCCFHYRLPKMSKGMG